MTITEEMRLEVRKRANFACEFCSVTETDTGGKLTIDHFHPQAKGGNDSLDNLIYCCISCNQYKLDYWPTQPNNPELWNPRRELAETHFIEIDDGKLYPLTAKGEFTLKRLRLNRPPLVAYRLGKRYRAEELRLVAHYRDLVALLEQIREQQATLLEEQRQLLAQQQTLLRLLLRQED